MHIGVALTHYFIVVAFVFYFSFLSNILFRECTQGEQEIESKQASQESTIIRQINAVR